jgi:hypothetical protein
MFGSGTRSFRAPYNGQILIAIDPWECINVERALYKLKSKFDVLPLHDNVGSSPIPFGIGG